MISLERLQEVLTLENIQAVASLLVSLFLFYLSTSAKVDAFFAAKREAKAKAALQTEQEAHLADNVINQQYLQYISEALNKVVISSKLSPAAKEELQGAYTNLQVAVTTGVQIAYKEAQDLAAAATDTVKQTVATVNEVRDILGNVIES